MRARTVTACAGLAGAALLLAGTGPADARPLRLHATGVVDSSTFLDGDQDGAPSAGDRLVQHEVLVAHSGPVGELTTACDIATAIRAVCTLVWRLPGATLTGAVQATDDLTAPLVVAVTGGTDRYARARGQVLIQNDPSEPTQRDDQDFTAVTLR